MSSGTASCARAARRRVGAVRVGVPDRRGHRRERDAERAREPVRPARVRLRQVQRAFLAPAGGEVRRLRQLRELPLRRRAAVPLLEPRGALAHVGGDRLAARGEQVHHLLRDALDLEPVPVLPGGPLQAEPAGQSLLQMLGGDRRHRPDMLGVAQRVRRPPLPVNAGPGDVGDLRVDVQLHVAVARGVLQPVRHRQVRLPPLARLPAADPGVVRAGAGVARLPLEVAEARVHRLHDHLVDLGHQARPVPLAVGVPGLAGQARVLPEGGVEDRDGLRQRQGQVEEQRALPRLAARRGRAAPASAPRGLRLGGQQPGIDLSGLPAAARRPAQRRAIGSLPLAEQQVVRVTLDHLARGEAERLARRGPTSGQEARRPSRSPRCNNRPGSSPGTGRSASTRSPGRSPCSACRQQPATTSAPQSGRNCP